MSPYARDLSAEIPGYDTCTFKLRASEMHATGRALMLAATICLLRAAIVPWALQLTGISSAGGQTDLQVVGTSLLMMSVFAMAALWARFAPFAAAMISLLVFAGVCAHDAMQTAEVLQQGLLSKAIVGVVLLRGLMNAALSRTL